MRKRMMTEYEEERWKRIQQNRSRMAALGLPNIASSLINHNNNTHSKHNKNKRNHHDDDDNDEEYIPNIDAEDETCSSSSSIDHHVSPYPTKRKKKAVTLKKKVHVQKNKSNSGIVDEDEAFLQAIALSLQEKGLTQNEGCSGLSKSPTPLAKGKSSDKKGNSRIQEELGTRKGKKQVSSRVQMSKDELVVHFFQFDDSGKGYISVNDIEIMATTHDFTWTDKELSDMIRCFNSDGTGKLSLDDFRTIVGRCNMIQKTEGA